MYRRLTNWLAKFSDTSPELRRAARMSEPGVVVYYWDGATPMGRQLRDISLTGAYLYTPERWYPGTIVRLLLQDKQPPVHGPAPEAHTSVSIPARVVWHGSDGVALEFLFRKPEDQNLLQALISPMPNCGAAEITAGV